jgi:Ca-activated chloride channel homolog
MTRFLVLAACVAGAATVVGGAQSPTFSSRVEAVRLDVLVSDKGRPIHGLTPTDFEVFDNGVAQAVDLVSFEEIPLNVVLALDTSSSLVGERLEHLRDASRAVLGGLKKNDQTALITFNAAIAQAAELTSDVSRVEAALLEVEAEGATALTDAAYAAITVADADLGRGLIILFSDGLDTSSWLGERAVIDAAGRSDVVVYGVAAAKPSAFLRDLTSDTGGRLYEVSSTRDLKRVFLSALQEFRQRYLISYTPSGVQKGGWHKVEVRVKGRRATVRARPGYLGS